MPDTPEEILKRIIRKNSVQAEVKKADAVYGDHIVINYQGKKSKFKLGGEGTGFSRSS